jgi:hypothetical protein
VDEKKEKVRKPNAKLQSEYRQKKWQNPRAALRSFINNIPDMPKAQKLDLMGRV